MQIKTNPALTNPYFGQSKHATQPCLWTCERRPFPNPLQGRSPGPASWVTGVPGDNENFYYNRPKVNALGFKSWDPTIKLLLRMHPLEFQSTNSHHLISPEVIQCTRHDMNIHKLPHPSVSFIPLPMDVPNSSGFGNTPITAIQSQNAAGARESRTGHG